jgi:hypothetical protein
MKYLLLLITLISTFITPVVSFSVADDRSDVFITLKCYISGDVTIHMLVK